MPDIFDICFAADDNSSSSRGIDVFDLGNIVNSTMSWEIRALNKFEKLINCCGCCKRERWSLFCSLLYRGFSYHVDDGINKFIQVVWWNLGSHTNSNTLASHKQKIW